MSHGIGSHALKSYHTKHNTEDKMKVIKVYLPLEDNDGKSLDNWHTRFIQSMTEPTSITGFTVTDAKGYWFDGDVQYVDNQRIYEFHLSAEQSVDAEDWLRFRARMMCKMMEQECIYMTIDNQQHFITGDK